MIETISLVDVVDAQAFVAIVHSGSLRGAAEALGVSAPTITRRLARLEADLGVRLVERTTRSLRLTELGRSFHRRCAQGLEIVASARALVESRQQRVEGLVRMTTAPSLGPLVIEVLASVRREHPGVRLQLVHAAKRLDQRRDDFDLLLRVGAVEDQSLVGRRVASYPHVLVAGREYLEAHGPLRAVSALRRLPQVTFGESGASDRWALESGKRRFSVESEPVLQTNDYSTVIAALEAGLGVGELPAILLDEHPTLVRVLPKWHLGMVPLTLLYPSDRLLSRAVRTVVDAMAVELPAVVAAAC